MTTADERNAAPPAWLDELSARVARHVEGFLGAEQTRWSEVDAELELPLTSLRDLFALGGKRLRPAFCYWAYVGSGGDPQAIEVLEAGAALEMLHTFALIHDDVMDGSDRRRGAPSVHKRFLDIHADQGWTGESRRFGEGVAILVGDLAFIYADVLMREAPTEARDLFDELRLELCAGQYLDILGTVSGVDDLDRALRIEHYKSGKYTVERPLHLGAALAGRFAAFRESLDAIGPPLGEAFQLRDDVLGAFGDAEITGKPVGDDLLEGKPTPLVVWAWRRASGADREALSLLGHADASSEDVERMQETIVHTGALAEVEERIRVGAETAVAAIHASALTDEARDALVDLAHYVAWRDR